MADKTSPSIPITTFLSVEGLAVLAAAGATAAIASFPWVIAPGLMAYGLLTYLRFSRWREQQAEAIFAPDSFDLEALLAEHRPYIQRCVQYQSGILQEIRSALPMHKTMLLPTIERVRDLSQAAYDLVLRLEHIQTAVRQQQGVNLKQEESQLQRRLQSVQDPLARERFQQALEQLHEKGSVLKELQARTERIEAQLINIELTLQTVGAQVIRIKSAEAGTASHESARVVQTLEEASVDVQALAETVEETIESSGSLEAQTLRAGRGGNR